jgi:hypothetical protein
VQLQRRRRDMLGHGDGVQQLIVHAESNEHDASKLLRLHGRTVLGEVRSRRELARHLRRLGWRGDGCGDACPTDDGVLRRVTTLPTRGWGPWSTERRTNTDGGLRVVLLAAAKRPTLQSARRRHLARRGCRKQAE